MCGCIWISHICFDIMSTLCESNSSEEFQPFFLFEVNTEVCLHNLNFSIWIMINLFAIRYGYHCRIYEVMYTCIFTFNHLLLNWMTQTQLIQSRLCHMFFFFTLAAFVLIADDFRCDECISDGTLVCNDMFVAYSSNARQFTADCTKVRLVWRNHFINLSKTISRWKLNEINICITRYTNCSILW